MKALACTLVIAMLMAASVTAQAEIVSLTLTGSWTADDYDVSSTGPDTPMGIPEEDDDLVFGTAPSAGSTTFTLLVNTGSAVFFPAGYNGITHDWYGYSDVTLVGTHTFGSASWTTADILTGLVGVDGLTKALWTDADIASANPTRVSFRMFGDWEGANADLFMGPRSATTIGTEFLMWEYFGGEEIRSQTYSAIAQPTCVRPTPILNANFDADVVDAPPDLTLPGPPAGDSMVLQESSGTVLVRNAVGTLVNKPIEMNQVPGTGGLDVVANVADGEDCESIVVSWRSLARSNDIFFMACVLRSSSGLILGSVEYRPNGQLTHNSVGGVGPDLPVTYTPDVDQEFTFIVDLVAGTTSLWVDGAPMAGFQDVPFPQAAMDLASISFEGGGTGAQDFAIDDILAVGCDCPLEVFLDIKPTSCPNPLNVKSQGVTPVAILGSDGFDVQDVDVSTLLLEGVPPLRWNVDDVAGPYDGDLCGCTEDGPDGFDDLTLKFRTQELVATLGAVTFGQEIELTLTGTLLDGTPFEASDCVIIRGAPKDAIAPAPGLEDDVPAPDGGDSRSFTLSVSNEGPKHRINYVLPEPSEVQLSVYNVSGRLVERLVQSYEAAGEHSLEWHPRTHPSGIYFYRLEANGHVATRKVILIQR